MQAPGPHNVDEIIENLKLFKKVRSKSDWVIPLKLKPQDGRDRDITRSEIYGILKVDKPVGYDFNCKEISNNLAKLCFIKITRSFNEYVKGSKDIVWTIFDNLDKEYCLTMIVHYEQLMPLEVQPFKREISDFIKIGEERISDVEISTNWRKNIKRKRKEKRLDFKSEKKKGGDKRQLPIVLNRYARLAELMNPFIALINASRTFYKKMATDPLTDQESKLFNVPISSVESERNDYAYYFNLLCLGIKYEPNREGIKELLGMASRNYFIGNGFSNQYEDMLVNQITNDEINEEE